MVELELASLYKTFDGLEPAVNDQMDIWKIAGYKIRMWDILITYAYLVVAFWKILFSFPCITQFELSWRFKMIFDFSKYS